LETLSVRCAFGTQLLMWRETCSFETKVLSVQLSLPTNFLYHRQDGLAKGEVDRSHGWKGLPSHRLLEESFHSSNLG